MLGYFLPGIILYAGNLIIKQNIRNFYPGFIMYLGYFSFSYVIQVGPIIYQLL
jgi:hypothetical protein